VFRAKREEVTEGWGKSNNEEYHNGYSSTNTIRVTNKVG
jgi:hypothetical protein